MKKITILAILTNFILARDVMMTNTSLLHYIQKVGKPLALITNKLYHKDRIQKKNDEYLSISFSQKEENDDVIIIKFFVQDNRGNYRVKGVLPKQGGGILDLGYNPKARFYEENCFGACE